MVSKEYADSIVAGALYDFLAHLTSRNERLVLSGRDSAAPAVEVLQDFAKKRNLNLSNPFIADWYERKAGDGVKRSKNR